MGDTVHHIELCEAILSLIERKRAETGNPTLGAGFERLAIDGQFCEIERDILENPGAIEPWLVKRRRGER
ncbi:MAG TPA: hypothetical protein VN893_23285 [Bryobacteraceae bacterium]|jgi:hypothetical protein|nr:hypothetical protein [Bryobacteraceae bacterium]